MNLDEFQKALSSLACPACEKGKLNAILRCDIDPKECVAKASCDTCQNIFHLNEGGEGDKASICQIDGMTCTLMPTQEKL